MSRRRALAAMFTLSLALPGAAQAAMVSYAFYGDDDWFGLSPETPDSIDPVTGQADGTDAPLTDTRLIAADCGVVECLAPPFTPTGSFTPFVTLGVVTAATLTMRMGAFDSGPDPFDGPNVLLLDGLAVPSGFLDGFSTDDTNDVQTRSVALPGAFFPLLADGAVSLAGTHVSNDTASGSFQVDMLRLQVVSEAPPPPADVPLPGGAPLALAGLGALAVIGARRRG